MSLVWIRPRDRADQAAVVRGRAWSGRCAVIDLQPRLLTAELGTAGIEDAAQCPSCTLVDFLAAEDLGRYPTLRLASRAFARFAPIAAALARGEAEIVRREAREVGLASCFEIAARGARTDLPRAWIARAPRGGAYDLPWSDVRRGDLVVVEPGPSGMEALVSASIRAARATSRVAIGYVEHAAAVESLSAFVEGCDEADPWAVLLHEHALLGLPMPAFYFAHPACALLAWRENAALEDRRARVDLMLRSAHGTASKMCAENVSGYTLLHDVRPIARAHEAPVRSIGVRIERLLLLGHG